MYFFTVFYVLCNNEIILYIFYLDNILIIFYQYIYKDVNQLREHDGLQS